MLAGIGKVKDQRTPALSSAVLNSWKPRNQAGKALREMGSLAEKDVLPG